MILIKKEKRGKRGKVFHLDRHRRRGKKRERGRPGGRAKGWKPACLAVFFML